MYHKRAHQRGGKPQQPLREPVFVQIASLEPATKGHNLKVTVISAQPPVTRHNAFGPPLIMREFLVGDATGCVILNLHNDQINLIEPGQRAILRNVKVVMVRGFMRLAVDKWGQIDPLQPSDAEQDPVINTANNISLVEYELVPNK
eukprot:TRINITY_DN5476_c0_g1_i3.p1 TRINITY_DN5476_c0_g1~~TRINITY_DN5476_c0_g1_i3.p1  ORF type:complete len:146 (+),score=29.23 TRINITY_DN5476_c0_g1_i3:187-624(+)